MPTSSHQLVIIVINGGGLITNPGPNAGSDPGPGPDPDPGR